MWDINLKIRNEQRTKKQKLTDTDNSVAATRVKWGAERQYRVKGVKYMMMGCDM